MRSSRGILHLEDLDIEAIHEAIAASSETCDAAADHDDPLGHVTSSYVEAEYRSLDVGHERSIERLLGILACLLYQTNGSGVADDCRRREFAGSCGDGIQGPRSRCARVYGGGTHHGRLHSHGGSVERGPTNLAWD